MALVMIKKTMAQVFIDKVGSAAKQVAKEYNLDWRFMMTQIGLESGNGASKLATQANNYTGFTGDAWEKAGKPVVRMLTWEQKDGKDYQMVRPFRAYASAMDSLRDYARLLTTQPRYAKAVEAQRKGDLPGAFTLMGTSGYATQKDYGTRLANRYNELKGLLA